MEKLFTRKEAAELLGRAPPIPPMQRYRLADMQAQVLALYGEVASLPRTQ